MASSLDDLQDSTRTEYRIEGKIVEKDTFQKFTSKWQEIEGSYHCAKTIDGGRNSFEAIDENGITWIYRCVMKGNFSSYSVDKR